MNFGICESRSPGLLTMRISTNSGCIWLTRDLTGELSKKPERQLNEIGSNHLRRITGTGRCKYRSSSSPAFAGNRPLSRPTSQLGVYAVAAQSADEADTASRLPTRSRKIIAPSAGIAKLKVRCTVSTSSHSKALAVVCQNVCILGNLTRFATAMELLITCALN